LATNAVTVNRQLSPVLNNTVTQRQSSPDTWQPTSIL